MNTLSNASEPAVWQQMAPLLDDAVAKLGATDRDAIVLRFFDGKSMKEVGASLGLSENSATKRIGRAVDKLRSFFAKKGVVLSATAVCAAISANAVQAAPVQFSASVAAAATTSTALSASTNALANGVMQLMAWLKIKMAVGVLGVALIAGGGGFAAAVLFNNGEITPADILKRSQQKYSSLSSYSDTWTAVAYRGTNEVSDRVVYSNRLMLGRPLLYRIESIPSANLKAGSAIWSGKAGEFWLMSAGEYHETRPAVTNFVPEFHVLFPAAPIPCAFFGKQDWDSLLALARTKGLTRLPDASIGADDCYTVLAKTSGPSYPLFHITLSIGKEDFLIRQMRFDWVTGGSTGRRGATGAAPSQTSQYSEKVTSTVIETRRDIVVNRVFTPDEFMRSLPTKTGTAVVTGAVFDQTYEREMASSDSRYLDLDTGEFVLAHPPGDLFWALGESDLQARAGMNMVAVLGSAEEWETVTAQEVLTNVRNASPKRQVRIGGSESKLESGSKRTWFFKTSEGAAGILQILRHSERPGSVNIRWKLVRAPSVPNGTAAETRTSK
jgi:hypothetical protein